MIAWILLFSLQDVYGAAAGTAEFSSYEACVNAGKKWNESTRNKGANYVCVPKRMP